MSVRCTSAHTSIHALLFMRNVINLLSKYALYLPQCEVIPMSLCYTGAVSTGQGQGAKSGPAATETTGSHHE